MEHKTNRKYGKTKWSSINRTLTARKQKRINIISTLDYYLSSTNIREITTIDTELSDHKLLVNKILWNLPMKFNKTYTYHSKYKVNEERIDWLMRSEWPDRNENNTKKIFRDKIKIKPLTKK